MIKYNLKINDDNNSRTEGVEYKMSIKSTHILHA
jgi:hypothetical protein